MPHITSRGWIRSDQLYSVTTQQLDPLEVADFLDFVLRDLACRPRSLKVQEVAKIVKYMASLALTGVPRDISQKGNPSIEKYLRRGARDGKGRIRPTNYWEKYCVEFQAKTLWNALYQCGDIEPAGRHEVLDFLDEHRATLLANPHFQIARDFVQNADPQDCNFGPPTLMSSSRSVKHTSSQNWHLQSDLSERMFVAYSALTRMGRRGVSQN